MEALAFIADELHQNFKPFFHESTDDARAMASRVITKKLQILADQMRAEYLFGARLTVADCFLFVMLLWATKFGITISAPLSALRDRIYARPAVQAAMQVEGLRGSISSSPEHSAR